MGKCHHDAGGGELSYAPRPRCRTHHTSLVHRLVLDGSRPLNDSRAATGRLESATTGSGGESWGPELTNLIRPCKRHGEDLSGRGSTAGLDMDEAAGFGREPLHKPGCCVCSPVSGHCGGFWPERPEADRADAHKLGLVGSINGRTSPIASMYGCLLFK